MYILLHSKDLPKGEYGFEVSAMIGKDRQTRYGKAFVTNCHSARSAMSYANGLVAGYSEGGGKEQIEIIQTLTFKAQLRAEHEEGA